MAIKIMSIYQQSTWIYIPKKRSKLGGRIGKTKGMKGYNLKIQKEM